MPEQIPEQIPLPELYAIDKTGNVYRIVGLPDYKPELPAELTEITAEQWENWHKPKPKKEKQK